MNLGLIAQGGPGWAGGTEYIRNLARAVKAAEPDTRLTLLAGAELAAGWRSHADLFDAFTTIAPASKQGWYARWTDRDNKPFARALRAAACDVIYPLTYDNAYNLGVRFPIAKALHGQSWLGWIPDFQHLHLPELFGAVESSRREKGIRRLLAEGSGIVLSSESALADLRQHYPEHANRAAVLRFGTHPEPAWYTLFEGDTGWLPKRFFLVSNQFWKHKNHTVVFQALRSLAARGVRPIVLCTGQLTDFRDPDYLNGLLEPLHRWGIASQVWLLGRIDRRLQIELMRNALAVIQPSRFEGWSTVVEDARVLGRPCLLSDIAVHREQHPPGARFFAPDDADALAELLAEDWEHASPGPDPERERTAQAAATMRIAVIGERMLRLIGAAVAGTPLGEMEPAIVP